MEALERELSKARSQLDLAQGELSLLQGRDKEDRSQAEMLAADKAFLTRELDQLRAENLRLEERAEKQSAKAKEAKRARHKPPLFPPPRAVWGSAGRHCSHAERPRRFMVPDS